MSRPKSKDLIIVSQLLEMAKDEFSNNGCNDLPTGFFDNLQDKEKEELLKEINAEFTLDSEYDSLEEIPDWLLMQFYSEKLLK